MKTTKLTIITIVLIATALAIAFYIIEYKKTTPPKENITEQTNKEDENLVELYGTTPPDADKTDTRGLHSTIRHLENGTQYDNAIYRFSIVLPNNWGDIREKVENGQEGTKIKETVRLTAENDLERYIQIQIVKTEFKNDPSVVDYPHIHLTENSIYSYYYSGGGDYAGAPGMEDQKYFDIQKEVKEISETFKLF